MHVNSQEFNLHFKDNNKSMPKLMISKENKPNLSRKAQKMHHLRTQGANSPMGTISVGTTDRALYERESGYRFGKGKPRISDLDFQAIESVLPCPHNPESLSELYLEG